MYEVCEYDDDYDDSVVSSDCLPSKKQQTGPPMLCLVTNRFHNEDAFSWIQ